ncbi:MAG TPA: hypothetical protein VGG82_07685 [Casimicrobiaceae bacterium]
MELVKNCSLLRIPVDSGRLFDGDEDYEIAMWAVVERVSDHNRVENERMERQARHG